MKRIVISQHWSATLSNDVSRGVFEYAQRHLDWMVYSSSSPLDQVLGWKLDGAIFPSLRRKSKRRLKMTDYPLVSTGLDRELPEGIPQVDIDHAEVGRVAARYFLQKGYESFSIVGFPFLYGHQVRSKAFCDEVESHGFSVKYWMWKSFGRPWFYESTGAWLRSLDRPAAVFCTSDIMGSAIIQRCVEIGLSVPGDVAVLGCEDSNPICESVRPTLSSVSLPYQKVGFEAMRSLAELMKGRCVSDVQLFPPHGVEERMSTGGVAVDDPHIRKAVEFIRTHFSEPISVDDVARHAGLSLRQLQRRFRPSIGHTAAREIQLARVEQVKRMLSRTTLSLADIAEETGYASEYYLGKNFKKIAGVTPSAYRKQYALR